MGHIAFDLPVFSGAGNIRELEPMVHGSVNEMVDQLDFIGIVDGIPDFMNAFQYGFRIPPFVLFEQGKGLVNNDHVLFVISAFPDQGDQRAVDIAQGFSVYDGKSRAHE